MHWGASTDQGGGNVTYYWALSSGQQGSTTGTTAAVGGLAQGNYSFTVYAKNPGGTNAPVSSAAMTVPNPTPSVTVAEGGAATSSYCTSTACRAVDVSGHQFPINSTVTISYYAGCEGHISVACSGAGNPPQPYATATVGVDGNGDFVDNDRVFGFPDSSYWVVVSGYTSNTITWQ
jgi:hypothetical protein